MMSARMYACVARLLACCVASAAAHAGTPSRTACKSLVGCDKCAANATCTLCSSPAYTLKNGKCGAFCFVFLLFLGGVFCSGVLMMIEGGSTSSRAKQN